MVMSCFCHSSLLLAWILVSDISEPLTEPVSLIDINDNLALSESISSTDECHVNHTDHSFMLSDEGGIITFDDDHGATD